MQIVADRFAVTRDGRAIDLVTGAPVVLKIGVGGGGAEQARWSMRCDALHKLHHPTLAPLLDYGALGESQRFEAWRCGQKWHGAPVEDRSSEDEGLRALRAASQFLVACGLTEGAESAPEIHESHGRAVVIPSAAPPGHPPGPGTSPDATLEARETLDPDDCGICAIERRADRVLEDLFSTLSGTRPHLVSVWGPPGSGRTTTALHAARLARLHGFVPIGVTTLGRIDIDLVKGRQVCLISDDDDTEANVSTLLGVVLASPRAHILLRLGRDEPSGMGRLHGIALERIPSDILVAAVRPEGLNSRTLAHVSRAAAMAQGLPARFANLLWRPGASPAAGQRRGSTRIHSRVAEQPSVYGSEDSAAVNEPRVESRTWPAPGELAVLRRRAEAAAALVAKGRHEPGVRQLRQAVGSLSRRGDWAHARGAVLVLASALLARGDARGALALLADGKACADRGGSEQASIDAAVLSGHAWIDLARSDEAESVIGAALAVARRLGDTSRILSASLALGRCLFWKGRYAEAVSALAPSEHPCAAAALGTLPAGDARDPRFTVPLMAAAARATVGAGDFARATSLACEVMEQASQTGDDRLIARASGAAAFVHLAMGDLDAVGADVRKSVAAARAAHDPLRAIRARLLLAESERRRGRAPSTLLSRVDSLRLPPIVRARVELLRALTEACSPDRDIAARHAGRTGLPALGLYVPAPSRGLPADSPTEALVGILHLCQTAEDETRILGDVCARIRRQLNAAAVAVLVREGAGASLIAGDGARIDPAIAVRSMTAGITMPPHRVEDRLESAAPVRYGGGVIGALAARWPLGTPYDLARAGSVLTMAAAAAAPVVSAVLGRRSRAAAPAVPDLLGLTSQMVELGRAIERAAAAPFAVLIEGESGSGKELVAKAVHRMGLRRDRPFCTLNCAALPDDLVEAELFGHARGAFTGAVNERAGVFEEAHGGTLFLDEVGELSPRAQAKLLRVIQEGELRRVGENLSRRVDVRIVSATNRDLRQEAAAGRFRLDLLYRLDVVRITVPPLRDRREDIAVLADHFWREATARIGSRAVLAAATTAALARYDWPGNVRELQNVLASLAVRSPRRGVVPPTALPPQFVESRLAEACRLDDARRTFEDRFVRAALVRSGGHRARAAAELGLTRQGLTKLMTRLGIA